MDRLFKKANARLYALRQLKKAGLSHHDLVNIYCSFLRPCVEYASPVWSDSTEYLSKLTESVQKRALKIIYPLLSYEDALSATRLDTLESCRHHACLKFDDKMRCDNQIGINPVANISRKIPRANDHNYDFRFERPCRINTNTERFSNFITVKYY